MPERAKLGDRALIAFLFGLDKYGKTFTLLYAKMFTNTNSTLNLMYRNDNLVNNFELYIQYFPLVFIVLDNTAKLSIAI